MRQVRIVIFVIDGDDPLVDLNSIIDDGAEAQGYTTKKFTAEGNVDAYCKLQKVE